MENWHAKFNAPVNRQLSYILKYEPWIYLILPDSKYTHHFCHPRTQVWYHFDLRTIYEYLNRNFSLKPVKEGASIVRQVSLAGCIRKKTSLKILLCFKIVTLVIGKVRKKKVVRQKRLIRRMYRGMPSYSTVYQLISHKLMSTYEDNTSDNHLLS